MKMLVVYDSVYGNTELIAQSIGEAIAEKAKVLKVDKVGPEDFESADFILIGSPTYYGLMSGKLKTFLDTTEKIHGKLKGKVGGSFTSSGGTGSGAETTLLSILCTMLIHGMIVVGRDDNKHYGASAVGAPKEKDIEICKELGRRIAGLTVKIHG